MAPLADDEEMTELLDADFPRVDLVGKGANGIPRFLVMKGADGDATGLLDPGFVRELIGKQAEPEPDRRERAVLPSGVTLSGSPADIAAFIHKAAQRAAEDDVAKAEMSSKSVNDLDDDQFAYIESGGKKDESGKTTPRSLRHFPINDAAHVRNALARASSSPFGDKAMPKIRAAAKRFKIDVAKEAAVAETVTKDMGPELDGGVDGMDPTVPLAEPDEMAPGDMTDPGSPAWESIDAATAQKWTSIAVRLKNALCVLAEREMLEAASADPDDMENAFDLQDAMCAVDYVIDTLAGFAVDEQAEADLCGEAMEAVGKSAADPGTWAAIRKAMDSADLADPLAKLEGLTGVMKAGRVLSSVNEAHIREAAGRLNTVLQSLPQAPTTDDGHPVAKEQETTVAEDIQDAEVAKDTASPEAQAKNASPVQAGGTTGMGAPRATGPDAALPLDGPQAALPGDAQTPGRKVVKSALSLVYDRDRRVVGVADSSAIVQQVAKADDGEKKPMQAVFDQDGDLIGIVDPDAIQPVTGAGGPSASDMDGDGTDAAPPASDDTDMTPMPAADAGTPADMPADDNVTKQDQIALTQDVLKSIAQDAARTALETQGATHAEVVAKMAADNAELAEELRVVKARLDTVENTPAQPKVFTNGQVPPAHQLRGQDQGTAPGQVDVAKALHLKHEMYTADPVRGKQIHDDLNQMARDQLAAIHRR